jgi:hypothetical protein
MTIKLIKDIFIIFSGVRTPLYCILILFLSLSFGACGKKNKSGGPRPLSKSANVLVNPPTDNAEAVLLHTVDSATEFPAALNSLEPDVPEPEVRAVQALPPSTSGSNEQAVEIVQPVRASVPLRQDWGGVILVPDMDQMSRGFTSRVTLTRIEAHPIANDYFRVWVRVRNDAGRDIEADVACNFRALDQQAKETEFIPVKIAKDGSANAYFISPMPNVAYYTILVR